MIRGIIALFTSGILINPLVLSGVVLGSLFYAFLPANDVYQIYKTPVFYSLAALLSGGYVIGFRRVYKETGETDWGETILAIIGGALKLIIASVLMISFISFFDFGDMVLSSSSSDEF